MSMKDLPEDLIAEIFLLLPIKSLIRFRCVSKRRRSLISDPQFAKSNLERSSEHTRRLLVSCPSEIRSQDVNARFGDCFAVRELVFPFKKPGRRVRIFGSSNGLVCVDPSVHSDFYVWNPSTGDHRKLPKPWCGKKEWRRGFGYDSSTDDYKLVVADIPEVWVFSLRKNSWKMIHGREYRCPYYYLMESRQSVGILFNGALHWAKPYKGQRILSFDLAEEKFCELPMPCMDDESYFMSLGVLGGRLCITCNRQTHIELWGMMKYGVQESWTRLFRVVYFDINYIRDLIPLYISRDGQLVAKCNDMKLIRYNPVKEIIESFVLFSDRDGCEAAVFVESLISPNDYNGDDGLHSKQEVLKSNNA